MSLFRIAAPRLSVPKDGDQLTVAGATVLLTVNRRARRIGLRIDRSRRLVVAVAPSARHLSEAAEFARSRAAWIAARMAELPSGEALEPETELQFFGAPLVLLQAAGRVRWLPADADQPARLIAPGEGAAWSAGMLRRLKAETQKRLLDRTAWYCGHIGRPTPRVAVMDARSRWGSCTPERPGQAASIRYSWRLALCPVAVSDYVVAHEVAHLIEANHGPRFWALVRDLVGDPAPHRAWLRREGAALHAVGRSS